MKKLVAMVAVAAGLMVGSAANAATFDVFVRQIAATEWEIVINNNSGTVGVGAINLVTTGITAMTLNSANTGISPADSSFNPDPFGTGQGSVAVNNNVGQAISAAGAQQSLIAALTSSGAVTVVRPDFDPNFDAPGLFDTSGVGIDPAEWSLNVQPLVVPEPISMALVGLGLAAFAMIRRSA
jgi:hypothetical protein